ncbi:hypothetical protein TeGR_g1719 [Tetraparma gracilis]|uniref:Uncharacterized protein n=1 Tax=Tetraparma gracilis TaxID=2962635 RepID=A0ABQ6N784_9STRA|nr:hypothetical protein TeGR_g1719 [Tetraparma gracilis]
MGHLPPSIISAASLTPALVSEMESARVAFWLCLFGAAGSGSMGRQVISLKLSKAKAAEGGAFDNPTAGPLLGAAALALLVVVVGLADYFAFYHLWRGWFPMWPGLGNLPASLLDPERGVAAIPKYWL